MTLILRHEIYAIKGLSGRIGIYFRSLRLLCSLALTLTFASPFDLLLRILCRLLRLLFLLPYPRHLPAEHEQLRVKLDPLSLGIRLVLFDGREHSQLQARSHLYCGDVLERVGDDSIRLTLRTG